MLERGTLVSRPLSLGPDTLSLADRGPDAVTGRAMMPWPAQSLYLTGSLAKR